MRGGVLNKGKLKRLIMRDRVRSEEISDLEEGLLKVVRSTKVVKGGRRFRFAAFMVVGNKDGIVGLGYGKANEIPEAVRKAVGDAKKHLVRIKLKNGTIPHEAAAKYCASNVWLMPATPGTGVIAGNNIRAVLEYAGVKNILSKTYGSRNAINSAKAAFACLCSLSDSSAIAEKRGKEVREIFQ